jgi:hypothetical protein
MALATGIPWADLDTKGFVHVPAFLTADPLQSCLADYAAKPSRSGNANYNIPGADVLPAVNDRIDEIISAVTRSTSIRVDTVSGASYFATKRGVKFGWHQDHESFFTLQTHANYLNFYIPIVKPRVDKSNLKLVPFDVLQRELPEIFRLTVFSGATSVYPIPGGQFLVQDDSGRGRAVAVRFDDIATTPQLAAGDLLLFRGDVFHKTQDTETERVSMSIRLAYSKTIVRRSKLADGGLYKSRMMVRNMKDFAIMFDAFDRAGRDELPYGELKPLMAEVEKTYRDDDSPKRYLLKQKIRSKVLLSSAKAAAHELVVNWLKYARYVQQTKKTVPTPQVAGPPV